MRLLVALTIALTATSLAGCTDAGDPLTTTTGGPGPDNRMTIEGIVQTPTFDPVPGVTVSLRGMDRNTTTGPDGRFGFASLNVTAYIVEARAAGYQNASVSVLPAEGTVAANILMAPIPRAEPYQEAQKFQGLLPCAAEALIISGSCDVLIAFANDAAGTELVPEPFGGENLFDLSVNPGWKTLVVDVVFDPGEQPGLDGLRLLVQGPADRSELTDYRQYGRWNAPESFTVHLTPGANHTDGDESVPTDQNLFRLQVLPHSHGYHAVCDPSGETCFLGLGAGTDVNFQLLVTAFYVAPAPEGWSGANPAPA